MNRIEMITIARKELENRCEQNVIDTKAQQESHKRSAEQIQSQIGNMDVSLFQFFYYLYSMCNLL